MTPKAKWEEEFDKRWFVKNGEMTVETFLEVKRFISSLLEERDKAINEILEAEYVINRITCPGSDTSRADEAPEQVVGTIHMSLARYRKIQNLLNERNK